MKLGSKILLVVATIVVAAIVVLVVLLKLTPEVYRRTVGMRSAAAAEQFDVEVINQYGNFMLDRSRRTPLEITLTEEMVNARVAKYVANALREGKTVPAVLYDARVAFEPGRLVLTTRAGGSITSVVLSQWFSLEVGPDGELVVAPAGTDVGLLPMPDFVFEYARGRLGDELERLEAQLEVDRLEAQELEVALKNSGPLAFVTVDDLPAKRRRAAMYDILRAIRDALNGQPVPLVKGGKGVVLDSVEIERGVLKIVGHRPR
jgi:hypothetical protein